MGKIATTQEAYERKGNVLVIAPTEPNKCCTKKQADDYKCNVLGEYTENQLVQLDDWGPPKLRNSITLQQTSTSGGGAVYFRTILKALYPVTSKLTITVYVEPADGVIGSIGQKEYTMNIGDDTTFLGSISEVSPTKSRIISGTPAEDDTYEYVYGMMIIG